MIRTKRIFHFAGQNFIRNAWLSAVTLTILVIMLLAVNLVVSVNYTKNELLKNAQSKVNLTINFKQNVTQDDVNQLADTLKKNTLVKNVEIITPEQHLENFKKAFPTIGAEAIPAIEENPLGFQLQIRAEEPKHYQTIIDDVSETPAATLIENQKMNDYRAFFDQAERTINQVNTFGLIIAVIFLLLGVTVVFNTIRVSVYTQREEVGIMKLVGATNWFVRAPFLLETLFYALVATMITFLVIYALLRFSNIINFEVVEGVPLDLNGHYQQNFWLLFLSQFAGIGLVNVLATSIALRRYLKV